MKLSDLVKDQGEIITISSEATVVEASKLIKQHRIGALMVRGGDGAIAGIISERDIVTGLSENGARLGDMSVSELMTSDLITCSPDESVNSALGLMSDRGIRHLPVFDGDDLAGFISIRDLLRHKIDEVQAEAEAMKQYFVS